MTDIIKKINLLIIGASVLALGSALIAQYAFGLEPCKLCIWQRWPFVVTGIAGLLAYLLTSRNIMASLTLIGLSGVAFLTNAGFAVFHSGVERKWWDGLTGCSAPDMSGSVEDLLARIQNSNGARCDEIAWADPILGLSMANYNIIYCLLLAAICLATITSYLKNR